jgi:formate dehydrogenase maturation protein FdhE
MNLHQRGRPSNASKIKAAEEIGFSELRTTEAKINSDYPLFKDGCPQCGEKPVVTMTRYFDLAGKLIRSCRCRACPWRGKLRN